ncbi:hypothetical protein MASR2M18_15660 [Ignavibacteria bacterium]
MKQEFYLAMAVIPVARSHGARKKMSLYGIMQMLCAIAVAICCTANAQAQYDNVPELEEWFGMECKVTAKSITCRISMFLTEG